MQSLGGHRESWVPPVVRTVATNGEGTAALSEAIDRCADLLRRGGKLEEKRTAAWQARLVEMIRQKLVRELVEYRMGMSELQAHARGVAARKEDPYILVDGLVRGLLDLHRGDDTT
jgi:LAO/AO transport system kinase